MGAKGTSLDTLWDSAPAAGRAFRADELAGVPDGARRYLAHAIAPGTGLASAVWLRMHGEIKLRRWLPFTAEEVIRREGEMIWRARVRMRGLPISGADRFVGGAGSMSWKLLGVVPVMTASGPDITRSAAGRVQAESVWLPSMLAGEDGSWTATDPSHLRAGVTAQGHRAELTLTVDEAGRLLTLKLPRWGNPGGAAFHDVDFGAIAEAEGMFCGYTIPTRLRAGWYFGSERFESEGEFFRVTIDDATFR